MYILPSPAPLPRRASPRFSFGNEPGSIRPLMAGDIPRIAAIFLKVFRKSKAVPTTALIDYLGDLYLGAPWHDPECGSLVHIGPDGVANGFMGVVQLNMSFQGRFLRAGVMGAFMVEDHIANRGVGARLLRTYLNGPQDVFFSDTANQISLTFAQKLKFSILPAHSLEWIKVLRPAGVGVQLLHRKWNWFPLAALRAFARAFDATAGRFCLRQAVFRQDMETLDDRIIDAAAFQKLAPALLDGYALRPNWNPTELGWLIQQAGQKKRYGPLVFHAVYDSRGELSGCYALYAQSGNTALALQIVPREGAQEKLVAAVIRQATDMGCVAVRGEVQPGFMEGLFRMPGVLYRHNGATVVRAINPDVAAAVASGKAFFGGFTGESWTRLSSDVF
jgi:hypothetical protein